MISLFLVSIVIHEKKVQDSKDNLSKDSTP